MSVLLTFNDLLEKAGLAPSEVRLLRHQERGSHRQTPYNLWANDRPAFAHYQAVQTSANATRLRAKFWAGFVVTPDSQTLFVGLFEVHSVRKADNSYQSPLNGRYLTDADRCDFYECTLTPHLEQYIGKLIVDWGSGTRSWIQRANSDAGCAKTILELKRAISETQFPGFHKFTISLDESLQKLPSSWQAVLKSVRGIYLLTCLRTGKQYVGQASGEDGFWGRWQNYLDSGHGGNEGMKKHGPSGFQVSILEASSNQEMIDALESLWKDKLLTRTFGLNEN